MGRERWTGMVGERREDDEEEFVVVEDSGGRVYWLWARVDGDGQLWTHMGGGDKRGRAVRDNGNVRDRDDKIWGKRTHPCWSRVYLDMFTSV